MHKFTPESEREAVAMYQGGASTYKVATKFEVSRTAVKMLLRRRGVTVRPPGRPSRSTEEAERQVRALRLEGVRLRDIARRVGLGSREVSEILIRLGLHQRLKRGENSTARRKIKPEQEPELVRLYQEGATFSELIRQFGCTYLPVRKALINAGVQLRPRRPVSSYRTDASFTARVVELWSGGDSITRIASKMDVGHKPVTRALNDHGIVVQNARGKRHGQWTGGRWIDEQGYTHVRLQPDHPFASMRTVNGYVLEHRLVMAEYLGRLLQPQETVHHINGDRTHNAIENLQLRIGKHGNHVCYRCADCGSSRLQPVPIAG